jgi:hypothetical protein
MSDLPYYGPNENNFQTSQFNSQKEMFQNENIN